MNEQQTIPQLEQLLSLSPELLFPVDTGVQTFSASLEQITLYIKAIVDSNINSKLVPAGTIHAFGGAVNKVPFGYFLCDGQLLLRAEYPALYDAIGLNNGYTSIHDFRIPDLRGVFLRGRDGGTGRDPDAASRGVFHPNSSTGDNVGSWQPDVFGWHGHTFTSANGGSTNNQQTTIGKGATLGAQGTAGAGGNETRPKNIYVNYIIKI